MYEVCSIKNANLSIKYEGIKLQKWLIVVNFFYFYWPLLLHPLHKHFEGMENVGGVPLGTFFGAISKNYKKKFVLFFYLKKMK